jgi:hypothetical protein
MKNAVFLDVRHVVLVRTDVSQERIGSIIRVTRIGELGTLAVTSNRNMLRFCHPDEGSDMFHRNVCSYKSHTASHPQKTAFFTKICQCIPVLIAVEQRYRTVYTKFDINSASIMTPFRLVITAAKNGISREREIHVLCSMTFR